jgi:hypothetical protein
VALPGWVWEEAVCGRLGGSSQAAQLRVEASLEGAEAVIILEGELDHGTAESFVACVLEVLDTKPSIR